MPRARVAEVFAALSLTTDLATGVPFENRRRGPAPPPSSLAV
jgi:hypothetical protein